MDKKVWRAESSLSPQAKGRVERSNEVFQDRFIKELAFREIKTVDAANKFLDEEYLDFLNRKFSNLPKSDVDYHGARRVGLCAGH